MAVVTLSDLRDRFGSARDQGARPTCLAFATSDAHAALRQPWCPLSSEFAFYHAQRRAGRSPSTGAILPAMLTALKKDGQPIESDWPYLFALPNNIEAYRPPGELIVFRRQGEPRPTGVNEIIEHLQTGQPSIVLMTLSDAFYSPGDDGTVRALRDELPDPARRHAVVAVGHGTIDGTRAILVRNSWGTEWGVDGHAWLLEDFIGPRLTRLILLTDEVHVPTQDLAA